MISTRAAAKRILSVNINKGVAKHQDSPKKKLEPRAAFHQRGRKPAHDSRALVAIGVKLAMLGMELGTAVNMVNHVCNNPVNAEYSGAQEKDLVEKTLRNRTVALLKAPWKTIKPQHVKQWEALVNEPIKELVFEVCARIKHDQDYAKLKNKIVVPEPVRAMVQVEVGQEEFLELNALDNNFGLNMIYPDHFIRLDPLQQPEQQLQISEAGAGDISQLDYFSASDMFDAEMDTTTYGTTDGSIEFDLMEF